MNVKINGEKSIDLSNLPINSHGHISWKDSVGMTIRCVYGGCEHEVIILESYGNKVRIFIKNYTPLDGCIIYTSHLKMCNMDNVFIEKIATSCPDIVQYLVDKQDAYRYSKGSGKYVDTICPICGSKRLYRINSLALYGFKCHACGDKISYPNKFMWKLLSQCNIKFIREVSSIYKQFDWLGKYLCDFYFEKDQKEYIIEMDGGYHFSNGFGNLNLIQKRDHDKDILIQEHGINVIRIDCNYVDVSKRFYYIKNNIIKSGLLNILSVSEIDWEACDKFALSNMLFDTCETWNSGVHDVQKISLIMNLSPSAIRNYLNKGKELKLCDYDGMKVNSVRRSNQNREFNKNRRSPIAVYKDENIVGVFEWCGELIDLSYELFGKKFSAPMIYKACKGDISHAYGYEMKNITKNQFNEYMNNEMRGDIIDTSQEFI